VVLRDRDDTNGWAGAADGTLEERIYYCQNWRADVSAIVSDAGEFVESVKYSSYGVPFGIPAGDSDGDGDADNDDRNRIISWSSAGYGLRGDLDLDGDVDSADQTLFDNGPSGETLGRGALSRSDVLNRKGYAGYENDGNLQELYHVRHRVLHNGLGRWTRRDPAGYVDGMNIYQYVQSTPLGTTDPSGLYKYCTTQECENAWPGKSPLSEHARCVCHCCVDLGGCIVSTIYGQDCAMRWRDIYKTPFLILCTTVCLGGLAIPGV
jgi:RHS repeat-associated protein